MIRNIAFTVACALALLDSIATAQTTRPAESPKGPQTQATQPAAAAQGRGGPGNRQIVLGPEDKQVYPDPPAGINAMREGVPHGKLEMIEYDSKTVGARRKMYVYTPPGYTKDQKYP